LGKLLLALNQIAKIPDLRGYGVQTRDLEWRTSWNNHLQRIKDVESERENRGGTFLCICVITNTCRAMARGLTLVWYSTALQRQPDIHRHRDNSKYIPTPGGSVCVCVCVCVLLLTNPDPNIHSPRLHNPVLLDTPDEQTVRYSSHLTPLSGLYLCHNIIKIQSD
jgi:hypothetical protein